MKQNEIESISNLGTRVKDNVGQVIVGKSDVVELVLVALLCEGHILLDDVPGIGKTMLARSVARSLDCSFRRIQFTPDLLPSDVTGSYIFNQKRSEFEFRPGPIMAQVILADEINRATPRTQSSLLEAMQEGQTTVEGETRKLPTPFIVIATENPIELDGTFPLPEAQLDRFLMRIKMGYPTEADDRVILERSRQHGSPEGLNSVVAAQDLIQMQVACREVHVTQDLEEYIIKLVHATRAHQMLEIGASPRAMIALYRAAQALAALRGRAFVIPDDVKYIVPFVLAHRIVMKTGSHLRGETPGQIIKEIMLNVPVPVEQPVATED